MNNRLFYTILSCIILGLTSRFLPHFPNFTALNAIALFSCCTMGKLSHAFFTIFITMFLSDLSLGFHSTIFYVYASLGLIVLLGWFKPSSLQRTWTLSIVSSGIFFIVTNFGEWLTNPLYTKNSLGLSICFLAATPFILNQVLGDLFYASLIFGLLKLTKTTTQTIDLSPNKIN